MKFAIELDRKGSEDMVFYDCKNKSFEDYIGKFGFKTAFGSSSDIRKLCPAWGIAGVNLSHGVYNCHTKEELIYVDEMFATINKVINILEDEESEKFAYKTATSTKKSYNQTLLSKEDSDFYNRYSYLYDDYDYGYEDYYPTLTSQKKTEEKIDADVHNYSDVLTKEEEEIYKSYPQWDYLVEKYGVKWAKAFIDEVDYQ